MFAIRLCILLAWACRAAALSHQSEDTARKLLLEIQSFTKTGVHETESLLADALGMFSRNASSARNATASGNITLLGNTTGEKSFPGGRSVVSRSKTVVKNVWTNIYINAFFIIPCLSIGGPLFWIWYHLEPESKANVIFTATDSDLREVQIREIGASGVALLRRQGDRHTGIMFAFSGVMLQTVFLYFIAVSCVQRIEEQDSQQATSKPTPLILLFCSLFCNTMVCCSSYIVGLKCLATNAPAGYEHLHQVLVVLDSFVIPGMCTVIGDLFLCTSNGISSLVFDATAMGFVISINMQIAGLMSWSLAGHGGRAFQPGNVSIKDAQNSTEQARYSFVGSVIVASVIMPLDLVAGMLGIVLVVLAAVALPFVLMGHYLEYYDSVDTFREMMYGALIKWECVKRASTVSSPTGDA